MATKIVTKNSSTASAVPTASDLVQGELAVNVADKRLFTEDNAGAIVELGTNPSGNVTFQDNGKAIFGAGSDLQIYHDGSHSYVGDYGTGNLSVTGNNLYLQNTSGETYLSGISDGAVSLYHNNAEKLATTSTGIDVTGTATMDGLVSAGTAFVNLTSRPAGVPATAGALWSAQTETGNYGIVSRASSTDSFTYIGNTGSAATLGTSYGSSGSYLPLDLQTSDKKRLSIASNGDISFYEDTGTTAKFFWDASAESLGIGTSSINSNAALEVHGGQLRVASSSASSMFAVATSTTYSDGVTLFSSYNGSGAYGPMIFDVNGERMRIDASGNVQIGTGTPAYLVATSDIAQLSVNRVGTSGAITNASRSAGFINVNGANGGSSIEFSTASANNTQPSERMRIDASGNFMVGATSAFDSSSFCVDQSGLGQFRRDGTPLIIRRDGSDGGLIDFEKDGASVGSIGVTGGDLMIGQGAVGVRFLDSTPSLYPTNITSGATADASIDIGTSAARFKDLYLSGAASMTGLEPGIVTIGTSSYFIGNATNGYRFNNAADTTNLMILKDDGTLLVGYTAADGIGGAPADNNFSELGKGYINLNRDDTATARQVQFGKNGVVAGYIQTAGSTTSYVTSSDQRLKENIADADDAGSKIDAIQVRQYDWKADGSHQDYGMIAQELQTVAPEAVSGDADSEEMMGVDYSKLVPMLIKEIQSLRNRVAQLEE